jgi:hypothetical protein
MQIIPGMPQANASRADQTRKMLPLQQRSASVVPSTFDEATNTVQVCWTEGSSVRRYDWWNDTQYDEQLLVDPSAVNMSRFNAGAVQVLDNHDTTGGIASILGIASTGWLEAGSATQPARGMATLRLSQRPELAGAIGDIKAGIIRDISFGYSVERYQITPAASRTDGGNVDLWTAISWTPQEISFVPVPADPGAGTRSAPNQFACEFTRAATAQLPQEPSMPQANEPVVTNTPDDQATRAAADAATQAAAAAATAAATAETQRSADITDLCTRHGVAQLAAGLIRGNSTVEAAQRAVLEEIARRDAASGGHTNVRGIRTERDETETRLRGIEEALMHRCDPRQAITDNGRQFRGMSLLEIGRDWLELNGVNTRGIDRMALATRMLTFASPAGVGRDMPGMHTTSDFSNILANVANKRLRMGYDENPGTYMRWARRAPNLPDFKPVNVTQLGAMPDLLQVNEAGEIKYGTFADGAETYSLLTYGRIVSLSRQAIINDDLRAFDRMVAGFGAASMRLENRTVYAVLTANANMADGIALFDASTHKNLGTGAGSALQFTSLVTMRAAMRTQKGLNSEELNLAPAYLIGPAALEQTMYQFTSTQYVPTKTTDINEFRATGRTALEPIVEPVLDGSSTTAWYAAASNTQVDTVEFAYLDGAEGPVMDTQVGFEVDGLSFKCRLDFAAKAIDYRGLYKAAGA